MAQDAASSGDAAVAPPETRRRAVPPRSERALESGTAPAPPRPRSTTSTPSRPHPSPLAALLRWAALLLALLLLLAAATRLHARLCAAHALATPLERALRATTASPPDLLPPHQRHDAVPLRAVLGAPGSARAAKAERARAGAVAAAVREGRWLTARPYSAAALERVRTAVLGPAADAPHVAASHLWLYGAADYVATDGSRKSTAATDALMADADAGAGAGGETEYAVVRRVPRHEKQTYALHVPGRDTHALVAFLRGVCREGGAGSDGRWLLLLTPRAFVLAPHLVRLVHALDGADLAAEPLVIGNTALRTVSVDADAQEDEETERGAKEVEDDLKSAGEGILNIECGALLSPAAVEGVCSAVSRASKDALLRYVTARDDAGLVITVLARAAEASVVHAPALFPAHGPRARAAFAAASSTAVVIPALSTDAVYNAGILAHEYFRVHEQAPTCNIPTSGNRNH